MSKLLAVAILEKALHQSQVEPAHPIRQPVLAQNRQYLAPAIYIAVHVGNRGDFHKKALARWPAETAGLYSRAVPARSGYIAEPSRLGRQDRFAHPTIQFSPA